MWVYGIRFDCVLILSLDVSGLLGWVGLMLPCLVFLLILGGWVVCLDCGLFVWIGDWWLGGFACCLWIVCLVVGMVSWFGFVGEGVVWVWLFPCCFAICVALVCH